MNIFVFDIETVPDVVTGRRLLGLENLPDAQVADAMLSHAKATTGQTFLKHPWHKIVAISVVFRREDTLKIWSLGDLHADESELIQRFYAGIEKYCPVLVSWNGTAFDLPVLHYRTLYHGLSASHYWESGDRDNSFKYNNYLNRYHTRHIDLMDTLAAYQQRAFARLDDIAVMLGLPGKMGMSGEEVGEHYLQGKLAAIRCYCEVDVLNTYLIFLRFQHMRGQLTQEAYNYEIKLTKDWLHGSQQPHFQTFLESWK